MHVNIQNTFGIGARNGVKCAVYGKAGRGKTMLCATAPGPIIISAEGGLLSLGRYRLPFIEIKTVSDLTNAHLWAMQSREARQFQTICIDSISEVAETVLANAKTQVKDPRQAYGELIDQMTNVIRAFRDLQGFNVVMTAKQEYVKDEQSGIVMNGPSLPGKSLTKDFPYFFDELFQIDIGKMPDNTEYRFLRTQPDFNNEAKDRSGRLAPVEEPNLTKIFQKINS